MSGNHLGRSLTKTLKKDEIEILSKGPKFSINNRLNDNLIDQYKRGILRLNYQYLWKNINVNKENSHEITKYPIPENIYTPKNTEINPDLKTKMKRINDNIINKLQKWNKNDIRPNITNSEMETLKHLKKREDLVFLPSDKGGEFCVINKNEYIELGERHLEDTTTYVKKSITPKTIETHINNTWRQIYKKYEVPEPIGKSYISTNTKLPKFYHLIKTHKSLDALKIRPIVASKNSPTFKMSYMLSRILKPILKYVPAHIESSQQLIDKLKYEELIYNYPCSLDVVSLYTSIPINEAIETLINFIRENKINISNIQLPDIAELLRIIMNNTYFTFNNTTYKQIKGLPMGSNISPILAITYMSYIETKALNQLGNRYIFSRYIDDCLIIVKNHQEADMCLNVFNSINDNIKFEIEYPDNERSINMLDFNLQIINNRSIFKFYQKSAKKDIFVNYNTALPKRTIDAIVINENNRRRKKCTHQIDRDQAKEKLYKTLINNGYKTNTLDNLTSKNKNRRKINKNRRNKAQEDILYLDVPFVSDKINNMIQNEYKKENINIRIINKNKSLRNILNRNNGNQACSLKNCIINKSGICYSQNCVYKISCPCGESYIGSTKRMLHTRVHEHLKDNKSNVFQHIQRCLSLKCENELSVNIISKQKDVVDTRIMEDLLIRKYEPTMNDKIELESLNTFLSF